MACRQRGRLHVASVLYTSVAAMPGGHASWSCQVCAVVGTSVHADWLPPQEALMHRDAQQRETSLLRCRPVRRPPARPRKDRASACERVAPHVACCVLHVACCVLHVACCMLHGCAASTRTCFSRTSRRSHAWRRCGAPHRRRARPAKRQIGGRSHRAAPLAIRAVCCGAHLGAAQGLTYTPPLP